MVDNQNQQRQEMYFDLSSRIAHIDNAQLRSIFDKNETHTDWGTNHIIEIGRSKVFVKRVPVTNTEYENMFSTKNIYDLPTYYNYGFGSAGLGVFRELITHIKTTNWVLDGAISTFPLMYHYRIIPFCGLRADVNMEQHASYMEYWGNHPNIEKYILDRANANYELVLFLEYIPYTVGTWLLKNPNKTPMIIAEMQATISFLRKNGIIHLDTDFFNILTDGKRAYLTDFGLVLDKRFTLTPKEKQFFKQNNCYDYGNLLWSLGSHLTWMYYGLSITDKRRVSKKYRIDNGVKFEEIMSILLNNIDDLYASDIMNLDKNYITSLAKYRSVIIFMHKYYSNMRRNNKKDTQFHHTTLQRLLKETGFYPDSTSKVDSLHTVFT